MGSTHLGDIPSGEIAGPQIALASVASNGASASAVIAWRAPQNLKITSGYFAPDTVTQNSAAGTASYRDISLINGGPIGTGTTVLGSLRLTASLGSLVQRSLTLAATATMSKGDVLITKQVSAGAASDDATILRAGLLSCNYLPR